eukprot:TRINITY_DN20965_c0_g1_i1.p1 TRINITY_DN20965_c0_g1~~TRINITY_DN20965_c0_g1_i1.p1  ORF type:complete len:340 (+),score=63.10 TRINITY_DN20965_c0_g1_i1:113-1132(+)
MDMKGIMKPGQHQVLGDGPRSIFSPGHRIRMNMVPIFINVFIPWGVYVTVAGICSFSMLYRHPELSHLLLQVVGVSCAVLVALAAWARRNDPEPTWYTYFAVAVTCFAIAGAAHGVSLYESHSKHFQQLQDLKLVHGVDAGHESGQNFLDTGVIYFAQGNEVDGTKAHHFKLKTTYCVAPVAGGYGGAYPTTLSYDFWMVGKDCCSIGSPDFRCGDWTSGGPAPSGVRVLQDDDIPFYRLAVQQAEATYDIAARTPIFFEWVQDPSTALNVWNQRIMRSYIFGCVFAFITAWFCACLATARFAFIGRTAERYSMTEHGADMSYAAMQMQAPKYRGYYAP